MARGIGARRSNELYGGLLGDYLRQAGGLLADRAGEVISGQALEEYIQSLFPGFGTYEIVDGKLTFPEARAPEGGVTGLFGEFMSGGGVAGTIFDVPAKKLAPKWNNSMKPVPVGENPTKAELKELFGASEDLRVLQHKKTGQLYVWPANEALHQDVGAYFKLNKGEWEHGLITRDMLE